MILNYFKRILSKFLDYALPIFTSVTGYYFAIGELPPPLYIVFFYFLFTMTVVFITNGETLGNIVLKLRRTSSKKKTILEEIYFSLMLVTIIDNITGSIIMILLYFPIRISKVENYIYTSLDIILKRKVIDLEYLNGEKNG
jgi:hypothetical protein